MTKINKLKNRILKWKDFYGQDIVDVNSIIKAKNINELKKIIQDHIDFLELQNIDAIRDAENFKNSFNIG